MDSQKKGFTLIELLIVVAIIAILAAIAVPNFLEAQSRSKVSRAKADMRSLATAIEAYAVDTNKYPPTHNDPETRLKYCYYLFLERAYPGTPWLSTPISYISTYPLQPIKPRAVTNQSNAGFRSDASYYFVNFRGAAQDYPFCKPSDGSRDLTNSDGSIYVKSPMDINVIGPRSGAAGIKRSADWIMFGLGPSGVQDLQGSLEPNQYGNIDMPNVLMCFETKSRLDGWKTGSWPAYDPTNGTVSLGFLYHYQGGGSE